MPFLLRVDAWRSFDLIGWGLPVVAGRSSVSIWVERDCRCSSVGTSARLNGFTTQEYSSSTLGCTDGSLRGLVAETDAASDVCWLILVLGSAGDTGIKSSSEFLRGPATAATTRRSIYIDKRRLRDRSDVG